MEIINFPDPRLFEKCKEVTVFGPELKTLLEGMWEAMKNRNGVGLAANQVGLIFNMFVMEDEKKRKLFIVNPKILKKSGAPANLREGCLSAPNEFITRADRALWVQVSYQDETGKHMAGVFSGVSAVCVQHEMEHLQGKAYFESETIPKSKRRDLAKRWGRK
jgi:peptide deformylase